MAERSRPLNCAIYTRKSSEEGLEQDFNSLDAQREACEAYIRSQTGEGWRLVPTHYNDGGVSGGTLERPGLKQLLADIASGKIDIVVVYKVDRLTRSLADFSKIVEVFDSQRASFVSITQQFNTTTSMGRLTLNMLLSFAQFEREVTGERIRDKFLASRKRGIWMGGHPPLGYDIDNRKLLVNETEAELVRWIFEQYAEGRSVRGIKADLDARGIRTKGRISESGRPRGGREFSRGLLYKMLSNKVYIGMAVHKDNAYPGEHDAIIDMTLWKRVQQRLATNRAARRNSKNAKEPSLLAGLLFDSEGNCYTPSHAVKGARRYRYYTERSLVNGNDPRGAESNENVKRLAAHEVERLVIHSLLELLGHPNDMLNLLGYGNPEAKIASQAIQRAAKLQKDLREAPPNKCREIITIVVKRIVLDRQTMRIEIVRSGLRQLLVTDDRVPEPTAKGDDLYELSVPISLRYRGRELKLVIDGDMTGRATPDNLPLIRAIVRAQAWMGELTSGRARSTGDIAKTEGLTSSYVTRVMRLAFLAPDITTAILDGRQPPDLTAQKLLRGIELPHTWEDQRTALGIKAT